MPPIKGAKFPRVAGHARWLHVVVINENTLAEERHQLINRFGVRGVGEDIVHGRVRRIPAAELILQIEELGVTRSGAHRMPTPVHKQEVTVELHLVLGIERLHLCLKRGNHGGDPWITRHQFFIGVRCIGNRL